MTAVGARSRHEELCLTGAELEATGPPATNGRRSKRNDGATLVRTDRGTGLEPQALQSIAHGETTGSRRKSPSEAAALQAELNPFGLAWAL